ncbi:hypothetical protein BCR42DRAFT_401357 [Absidia repens]|uniref:Transcription elongation factor Eaf N-terminal domain-containing protein n=1 Tax=Absidia repens TaxID=90262 RepID=A0A1X2J2E5_9FUNG|nr:hypothetical protein BCR42DRAFT_401357 [Absidia repens]
MTFELKSGNYAVQTGKSFSDPSDSTHDYYTLRFTSKLDPTMPSRTATLRQENDTYFADWALSDNVLSYEGVKGNVQEMDCLLIFDEETQTFTIERPSLKTTLKKSKKSTHAPTNKKSATTRKGKSKPAPPSSSTTETNNYEKEAQKQTSPISLALPQQKPKDTQGTATSPTNDNDDSFDDDILRDMDEILNSNDDDDDDDDDNTEFETITTPHMSNDSMQIDSVPLPISPRPAATSSPGNQQQPSTPGNRRRQVLKMASAPIRRLDSSPPTPAPTPSSSSAVTIPPPQPPQSPSLSNKRPRTSGKTISAETLAARRKAASAIRSDSSSGSSSSGSDSSSDDDGSGSSGSSGSGSDSDDDDMDLLAANISQGLSENETRRPSLPHADSASNHLRHTPNVYDAALTPTSNRGSNNVTPGPTSLRDLLGKGDQHDDDDVSSSDDDG